MSVFVATTAVGWGHGSVFACPGGVVTDCFSLSSFFSSPVVAYVVLT